MTRWMIGALFGATLFTAPLVATARPGGGPDGAHRTERLTEVLGLDPATAEAVAAVTQSTHAEGRTLRESARAQAEALRTALDAGDTASMEAAMEELQRIRGDMQALHEATRTEVEALLTPEQRARWTLHHIDNGPRRGPGGPGRGPGGLDAPEPGLGL